MAIDTHAEILRLRAVLRDLVALSTIPAAWVGTEPRAVAAGLADALIGLLRLDFAFVRLCDPGGAGTVEVTRGKAWKTFPEWLERRLATRERASRSEIIPDVDAGMEPSRGAVMPIGVGGQGGVVAAACQRPGFPTEIDQLLLSLAANHAATAFQGARLIHERTRAEQEVRKARSQLEVKVAERTAELRRSEAYLSEAQRLTGTGSFALDIATGEPTHSSDEHSRLFGFDPCHGVPSLEELLQRVHSEDRASFTEALERGIREAASFEMEYRIVVPQGTLRYIRVIAHPVFTASGRLQEFVGTVMDVTEHKRAEEERRAQLWFFESMDRINRATQGGSDLERMMGDVLEAVLAIFKCDRAWLVHPSDREAGSHQVRMERTRPEYVGVVGLGVEIPNDPGIANVFRSLVASSGPVRFDPESGFALPSALAERFSIRSMIATAVYPKVDKPYVFGLHQCSYPRVWTAQEERLFQEIGRRLADALDTLLMFRDLRESERKLEGSRTALAASRARIVAAADAERRRVVRDLHDGAQQRLVHTVITLQLARRALQNEEDVVPALVTEALEQAERANAELRELAHGILPSDLTHGGLRAGVRELASRMPLPVTNGVSVDRLPAAVEATAYFVIAEALTNVAKHARARHADVMARVEDGTLAVHVRDDGVGGARPDGSGLLGLADRLAALDGRLRVESPADGGTLIAASIPLAGSMSRS
jgi:signal transduction histidine kinase/PAS domain-containing protein